MHLHLHLAFKEPLLTTNTPKHQKAPTLCACIKAPARASDFFVLAGKHIISPKGWSCRAAAPSRGTAPSRGGPLVAQHSHPPSSSPHQFACFHSIFSHHLRDFSPLSATWYWALDVSTLNPAGTRLQWLMKATVKAMWSWKEFLAP